MSTMQTCRICGHQYAAGLWHECTVDTLRAQLAAANETIGVLTARIEEKVATITERDKSLSDAVADFKRINDAATGRAETAERERENMHEDWHMAAEMARRFYNADGSFIEMPAIEVIHKRIEAAKELAAAQADAERLRGRCNSLTGWYVAEECDDGSLILENHTGDRKHVWNDEIERLRTALAESLQRMRDVFFDPNIVKNDETFPQFIIQTSAALAPTHPHRPYAADAREGGANE